MLTTEPHPFGAPASPEYKGLVEQLVWTQKVVDRLLAGWGMDVAGCLWKGPDSREPEAMSPGEASVLRSRLGSVK